VVLVGAGAVVQPPAPEVAERFWAKVPNMNQPDGCWEWHGAITQRGYGLHYFRDPNTSRAAMVLAHRVAFYLWNGRLPKYVIHGCGNTQCVRPTHLFDGNPFRKPETAHLKERLPGRRYRSSFLTPEEARKIRFAAHRGEDEHDLARQYNVDRRDIARVTMGRTFRDVDGPIRGSRFRGIRTYREEWLQQMRECVS
jgi:HNH endonuclease